jgi:hypothetical protein
VKGLLRKAKARTLKALFEATHRALSAVTEEDARGFFAHCSYAPRATHYENRSRERWCFAE